MGIKNFFKRFIQEEEGATAVEYAVMIVLIIVVCIATVSFLGTQVELGVNKVASTMSGAVDGTPAGG
jgi:pilus assembly protein Flp/PilA